MPERGEPKLTAEQMASVEHLKDQLKKGKAYNDDYVSPEMYQRVFDGLGDLSGKKIAELGAGLVQVGVPHGTFYLPALENRGAALIPIDLDAEYLRTWNLQQGQDIKLAPLAADAFHLPLRDSSLDGCISVNLLNVHWSSRGYDCHALARILLGEMNRVLKKDGFAIVNTFGYYKNTHTDGRITYNNDIPEDQILTAAEVRQAASQMGFREISDIPLDEKRIGRSRKGLDERKGPDVLSVDIVEPAAFLMKK